MNSMSLPCEKGSLCKKCNKRSCILLAMIIALGAGVITGVLTYVFLPQIIGGINPLLSGAVSGLFGVVPFILLIVVRNGQCARCAQSS